MPKRLFSNKTNAIILSLIAVVVVGGAVYVKATRPNPKTLSNPYHPKAADTAKQANQPEPVPASPGSKETQPVPAIPKSNTPTVSASGASIIDSPHQGDTVTSGTTVSGTAQAGSIYYRLKTVNNGQVGGTGPITVSGGRYSFQLLFDKEIKNGPDQGTLQIYTVAPGGAENNVASVNVYVQG